MKQLILAEKPSVGKAIGRVLKCNQNKNGYLEGNQYIVTWAMGHLVTLSAPDTYDKKYAHWHLEDLPIMPKYLKTTVIKKTGKQFSTVKMLLNRKDVSSVVIATDAGREGELVARWILDKAQCQKKIQRLWISSVTDKAIKDGMSSLKDGRLYENLYRAAVARAEGDWLVGINATRALTTKYNTNLSCGRVQTPTLAMIATREREIAQFRPKKQYGIKVETTVGIFTGYFDNQTLVFDENKRNLAIESLKSEKLKVSDVQVKDKKEYPGQLYDLTELQRVAFNRYGYSPKKTLQIMQRLYEHHKILTYPRTDSRYLTKDLVGTMGERLKAIQIPELRKHAHKILKSDYKLSKNVVNDQKVTDHHAIIPTEESAVLQDLSYEERQIYELVVIRFLEVFMEPAIIEEVSAVIPLKHVTLKMKQKVVKNQGFKVLTTEQVSDKLSAIKVGDELSMRQYTKVDDQTKPPSYFNEATLLSAMENPSKFIQNESKDLKKILGDTGGLGTVATRADIIEKLYHTEVIKSDGKSLRITNKGKQLLDVVPEALKSPVLTAEWEKQLSDITAGKFAYKAFISNIKGYTNEIIDDIKGSKTTFKHDNLSTKKCPNCGKLLMKKKNKQGDFLVCQDRECKYKETISMNTNARCPECHKKMTMTGQGDKQTFRCKCGYRESLDKFKKRKSEKGGSKKDYMKYMKSNEKEAPKSSAFDKLKNLKL